MSTDPCEIGQSLRREVLDKAARLLIPWQAALELTYRCNLHCSHCYNDLIESDELSLEEWKGVLDQLRAAGTTNLLFTGGEVMMRSDLLDILAYARHAGFAMSLISNCTLLTRETIHALVGLKVRDISTSLYGATAATHESVTGVRGSFEKTIEGIRLLVDAGLVPGVNTTLMKINVEEIPDLRKLVADLGAVSRTSNCLVPSKTGEDYPLQQEATIDQFLSLGPDTRKNIMDAIKIEESSSLTCHAGLSTIAVSPSGNVTPCLSFPLKMGNLRQSSFDSIWRLEPCAELRYLRSMRRSDLHTCLACNLKAFCYRCVGSIYTETGKMTGPGPAACRQAYMRWQLTQATEVT